MIFSLSSEYSEYENSDITSSTDIWMSGYNFYLGSSIKFPASLKIYGNYIHSSFEISGSSSVDKVNIGVNYNSERFSWDIGLKHWQNNISDSLGWVDYYKYFEKVEVMVVGIKSILKLRLKSILYWDMIREYY